MNASPSLTRRIVRAAAATVGGCVLLGAVALAGVVFAWARLAHSMADLRGWHTTAPASEFRASDATPAYTFTDYLAQEDRVFAELDSLVHHAWAGEAPARFSRYNPASVCNPATLLDRDWNRSYVLDSAPCVGGALLVHGLSDSPYSLRALGARLHAAGYTVIGLRVPGHGTCPKALADASWPDWAAAVRVAMRGLRERVPPNLPLIMVGYSNGGALCVNDVAERILGGGAGAPDLPRSIVLISPMMGITPLAEFTELYPAAAWLSGEKKLAWGGVEPEIDPFKYSSWPTNASLQAHRVTNHVEAMLARMAAEGRMRDFPPVLTVQSVADNTVIARRLIDALMDRVTPGTSELLLFDVNRASWLEGFMDASFERSIRPRLSRGSLPFTLTLVTNGAPDSPELVARTYRGDARTEAAIGASWPQGMFSLSHVALPIRPDDPIYGVESAGSPVKLPLGALLLRGETGVLAISPASLLRVRHNPFYAWTEDRILEWLARPGASEGMPAGPAR